MTKPFAVFLTDTHLKKNNLDLVYDIFKQSFDLARGIGVKYVFHGGDFFTNRVGQNLKTLLMMNKILEIFEGTEITLMGIPGNHDKTNQDSEESYLDIFKGFKNFNLVSEENFFLTDENIIVSFLPFFTSSYKERLNSLKKKLKGSKNKKILITHIAFNGVKNNDGSLVEDGFSKKDVKFFDKVLVGHYHDSSKIGDNIHYTGSAYQANYGENSSDKGFVIINTDLSLEYENSLFPKYIKVKLDIDSDISSEVEAYSDIEDYVRFIFKGKRENFEKIDRAELSDLGIECKFEPEDLDEEILKAQSGDFTSFDKKSIMKLFIEYCKDNKIKKHAKEGVKILLSK